MANDDSDGLVRRTPTPGQNALRRTAAVATYLAPTAVLAGAEHLAWGGNPFWLIQPPATWTTGDVHIDLAAGIAAVGVGYVGAKVVSKAIQRHQTRPITLNE